MTRVLFVCTGNVHRSVLAERLLAARLPAGSAVRAESAGTLAHRRPGMESGTRAVLERLGGDGHGFSARPLTGRLVAEASLVLGLAREHREAAVRLAPAAMRRCFTLKEFVRLAAAAPGREEDRRGDRGGAPGADGGPGGRGVPWTVRLATVDGRHRIDTRAPAARGEGAGGAGPAAGSGTGGGFDRVVAAAASRRGSAGAVPEAEDDVADPWAKPHDVLYACAREIDQAVSRLALLLGGGREDGASA
ncbi:hypothetical protein AB0C59_08610 [Streptomyces sp. NPDC048664]|uniref:arsenate reductase/protein-tyrosine-phosphatase family protein n=1 Tax=Streptomyces sp. NPDC048664 TaxID=3154505 RepID=UPI0034313325